MIYNRTTWENSPSTSTPINAQNLNKIEQGITDAANEINAISHIVNVGTEVEEDSRVNFIHSRNLWKQLPNTQTLNGITLTNNGNGTFNLSGTATANTSLYVELDLGSTNLKNGTYTLSKKSAGYNIQLDFYNGTTYVSTPIYCYGSTLENSATLSIGSNVNKIRYIIYVANGSSVSLTNEEIMLNSGNEALPYEPYVTQSIVVDNTTFTEATGIGTSVDSSKRLNVIHSRNLLPNNGSTTTTNGITFTKNSDGSITINGTSTGRADLYIFDGTTNNSYLKIKKGTYSFDRRNLTDGKIFFAFREKTAGTTYETLTNNSALELMATQDCYFHRVMLGIESGNTINNLTIYPMLNEGSEALPYEPYIQNQIVVDDETFTDTVKVSNEVDGKSRVNFIHSRNLFDASIQAGTYGTATYSVASDGLITQSATDSSSMPASDKRNFKLKKGTYTASIIGKPSNVNFQMRNITTSSNVFEGVNNSYTFTLTDDSYVAIKCWSASATYPINYYIMLVEGSRALDYEPYNISSQIVVDNETFTDTLKVGTDVDSRSRVNVLHSKNLFDKDTAINNYGFPNLTDGTITYSASNWKYVYISCKPNTKYTLSGISSESTGTGITMYSVNTFLSSATTYKNGTFTTASTATKLCVGCRDTELNTLQLEEGSTATPYQSFTTNEINIDNEKFADTLNVSDEVDSRSRVNIIKQVNNILPKGTIHTITSDSVSLNFKVPKANTQYTMKTNLPETGGLALVFFGSGANAQVSSDVNGVWVGSPRTMTSDANGYVTIAFRYLSGYSSIKLGDYWYTLAEGTSGVDYITPSINVDGEMLVSKNTYSTSEVVIGEWFGKPLYRKVISITNPTLDAWTNVNHNISNMDFGRIVDATLTRTIYGTTSYIPIGVSNISAGTLFTCDLQKTIIEYKIAGYTNITNLNAVLEYTKTID